MTALATTLFQSICKASGLPVPVPEFQFCAGRKWRFDWAWEEDWVALEIEGGLYGIGKKCPLCGQRKVAGHGSIERKLKDKEKYNTAHEMGWFVLRCTPKEFETGDILPLLQRVLR